MGEGDSVPVTELSAVERSFVSEKEVLFRRRKFCVGKGSPVSEKWVGDLKEVSLKDKRMYGGSNLLWSELHSHKKVYFTSVAIQRHSKKNSEPMLSN